MEVCCCWVGVGGALLSRVAKGALWGCWCVISSMVEESMPLSIMSKSYMLRFVRGLYGAEDSRLAADSKEMMSVGKKNEIGSRGD